jgi:hypothetical protein
VIAAATVTVMTQHIAPSTTEHRPAMTYRRRGDGQPVTLSDAERELWEEIKALPLT